MSVVGEVPEEEAGQGMLCATTPLSCTLTPCLPMDKASDQHAQERVVEEPRDAQVCFCVERYPQSFNLVSSLQETVLQRGQCGWYVGPNVSTQHADFRVRSPKRRVTANPVGRARGKRGGQRLRGVPQKKQWLPSTVAKQKNACMASLLSVEQEAHPWQAACPWHKEAPDRCVWWPSRCGATIKCVKLY